MNSIYIIGLSILSLGIITTLCILHNINKIRNREIKEDRNRITKNNLRKK